MKSENHDGLVEFHYKKENIRLVLVEKEEEIQIFKLKCDQLEIEKLHAVNDLKHTQVMSEEQLKKLFDLETKQDLLEVENMQISEKLKKSEFKNRELENIYSVLQDEKAQLKTENKYLLERKLRHDLEFKNAMEQIKFKNHNVEQIEKLQSEYMEKLKSREEKIKEFKEEISILQDDKADFKIKLEHTKVEKSLEIQSIKDEHENLRKNLREQIRNIQEQFEISNDEKQQLYLEKVQLENNLSSFDQLDYEETIEQLKLDLKQMKILFKNSQKEIEEKNNSSNNAKLVKQLKNHIDEVESERNALVRQKKNVELDFLDAQDQLEEILKNKNIIEAKYYEANRENMNFAAVLKENEEEMEEIMKKYESSVSALTLHQQALQNQSFAIVDLEHEKAQLMEEVEDLLKKIAILESERLDFHNSRKLETKIIEIKSQLELEVTSRHRNETMIERLKQKLERSEAEFESMSQERKAKENMNIKLISQLKAIQEDYISLQVKEMGISESKNAVEKRLEISEAETMTAKSQLELANRRIEYLHSNLNCETDSDCSSLPFSDGSEDDLDIFLHNHRQRMAEQKEEENRIRESIQESRNIEQEESEC